MKFLQVYELNAVDSKSPNAARLCRLNDVQVKVSTDERDTGGLDEQIILAEGSIILRFSKISGVRVMLKRNIDVANGLTNGSMGIVKKIEVTEGRVVGVTVEFDKPKAERTIERVSADFEVSKDIFFTRTQFPLTLG